MSAIRHPIIPLPRHARGPRASIAPAALFALLAMMPLLGACCATTPPTPGATTPEAANPPTPDVPPEVPTDAAAPTDPAQTAPQPKGPPDEALVARCSKAMDYTTLSPDEAAAWRAECKPAFDCTRPPEPRACCLALTPDCMRCAEEGQAHKAAFDYACFGETSPVPVTVDCSVPPPLTPCCKALLPKCLDCVAKNRYLAALHAEQCGK